MRFESIALRFRRGLQMVSLCAVFCMGFLNATPAYCGLADYLFASRDDDSASSPSLQDIVTAKNSDGADNASVPAQVKAFYESREYRLAWSGNDEAAQAAAAVKLVLEHADRQGLRSKDYTTGLARWNAAPESPQDAAEYDVALTEALLRYAHDVRDGRVDPHHVYKDVVLPSKEFDPAPALANALREGSLDAFLDDLPPRHPGYHWLAEALARYRAASAQGGWPSVSAKSELAMQGSDGKPTALARRLAFEDPAFAEGVDVGDADVGEALKRFQQRNGLEDSGKLDSETVNALNVPVARRIQAIIVNMERWRWVPREFESRYILVNVPDQSLDFVENQTSKLHSKVVIGKKTSPTPILRTAVEGVIANPPWDIPDDIAAKKLLPHLRHDRHYLATHNMVFAGAPGDYHLEQNPGPGNVLGVLMLDSPNTFGVYMHDTSDKKLFLLSDREKSNGCVRVEKIMPLAALVLGHDPDDNDGDIQQAIATGSTQRLELPGPVAVYMLYWTAMAGADGSVEFRPDIYGRDAALIAKLGEATPRKPSHVTAAVP
jgi:L,D-transpeptidase YcbB